MRADTVLIGVDVGTSGVRACAFSATGVLVASGSVLLTVCYPRPGWAEQAPLAWLDGACAALTQVATALGTRRACVKGIGLTGQCPTFTLVDDGGTPLVAGLIHQDNRAVAEAEQLALYLGTDRVRARTGAAPSAFSVAPKAMWLGRQQPALRDRRPWLAQPRDLVGQHLTGALATDSTHAACTGLYDLHTASWATDWAAALALDWLRLPPVVPPLASIGALTPRAAATVGLPSGIPVTIGAADNFCAAVAVGATRPGVLADTSGSSSCLDVTVEGTAVDQILAGSLEGPRPAPAGAATDYYPHIARGWCFADTGLRATGTMFQRAARVLSGGDVAQLEDVAASVEPCAGPLLLPATIAALSLDAGGAGAWHRLRRAHGSAHLARSVYEGMVFALRRLADGLRAAGHGFTEARLSGGGSRSALWTGLKADLWDVPVRVAQHAQTSAQGAALLAGVSAGVYGDLEEAVAYGLRLGPSREPDPRRQSLYGQVYERWRALQHPGVGALSACSSIEGGSLGWLTG